MNQEQIIEAAPTADVGEPTESVGFEVKPESVMDKMLATGASGQP